MAYETEDPYLIAIMGGAYIKGLQGESLSSGIVATAKHFVGYPAAAGGRNWGVPHIPDRELREKQLAALVRAGLVTARTKELFEGIGVPVNADLTVLEAMEDGKSDLNVLNAEQAAY